MSTASFEAQIAEQSNVYQQIQRDYSQAVETRQRLDAQKSENESVKKEFASLAPENGVFKLVGPVLLKQDQDEAKANVNKRLEYIAGEIQRVEGQLKDLESKLESKKMELVHLQTQLQQKLQADQEAGAPAVKGAPIATAAV